MKLRFIQWNIKHNSDPVLIVKFIQQHVEEFCLVQLQEVTTSHFRTIANLLEAQSSAHSLTLRPKGKFEGKNRELGVATFVFGGELTKVDLLHRSVFPERTLISELEIENTPLRILNFHSLTGVGYRHAKSSNFSSIADYLHAFPVDIFSCDANEPNIDALDIEDMVFFDNGDKGKCASLVFGRDKVHELNDVWRTHTHATGLFLNLESQELPISYAINSKLLKRYDFIYAAKHFQPIAINYLYNTSILASSDHAMVVADLLLV